MSPRKEVLIYNGPGAGSESLRHAHSSLRNSFEPKGFTVSSIDPSEIRAGGWEKQCAVFVMPGGADVPFCRALNGEGNKRIRGFVENGGSYLGLCAGAYYGCSRIEFDRGYPLEVCGARELNFYSGMAWGPAYGPATYDYQSEAGAKVVEIVWLDTNERLYSYYNGGCCFTAPYNLSVEKTLARYMDIEGDPPAIVQSLVGSGSVLLSGIHPEYRGDIYEAEALHIREKLLEVESTRARLWDLVMSEAAKNFI